MQSLVAKENTVYCNINEEEYGEYVNDSQVRYNIMCGLEVYLPDNADITQWKEYESVEACALDNGLILSPLTEEEIMALQESKNL